MIWTRPRDSALADLAPLVRASPCGIHVGTTQTDVMPLHTRVEDPLCPRGLYQFAVAVQTGTRSLYERVPGAPFCIFSTSVSLQW